MRHDRLISIALGLALAGISSAALAVDDYNRTVNAAGVQSGTGYFSTVEQTSAGCLYGVIYIPNLSADAGQRTMYATVLSAQSGSRKITHVAYDVDSTGRCTASLIETAP